MEEKLRVGLALTGSYCTFDKAMAAAARMANKYDLTPIMSERAYSTDTRFGKAEDFRAMLEGFCGKKVISQITEAEPIGPQALLDVLVIAPCTGNTLAKLANGITDTSVTMAAKAHMRNGRPVVIALSTNDALSANAKNIGALMARRGVYFVPFRQDDPIKKETSLVSEFGLIERTIDAALAGKQIQPLILGH
jgi:dipicolinate synthase subunit B